MKRNHRPDPQASGRGVVELLPLRRRPRGKREAPPRRSLLAPVAAAAALSVTAAVVVNTCTVCCCVVNQEGRLAYVGERETYQQAVAQVETTVSRLLQTDYQFHEAEVATAIARRADVQSREELADTLMGAVEQVGAYYVLTIDGEEAAACTDRATIEQALDSIRAGCTGEDTLTVYYDSTVDVRRTYLPLRPSETDPQALAARLLAGSDTVPPLRVCTVEEETSFRPLPAGEEVREDAALYVGERMVLREGLPGQEVVTERVTYVNGQETAREEYAARVLVPPVPAQVAVGSTDGTVPLPGRFCWPCTGSISSAFGSRYIFGSTSFHGGLDIADATGTPIVAAADGLVLFAGSKGTYGNLLILDHGNGFLTYYGHCSALVAQVGQRVAQGEVIGKMGSTGRATGSHCHFEIRWQNQPMDPQPYLNTIE